MRIARVHTEVARQERRPCHRCGWTSDLVKVGRREARGLGISTAQRWLCEDCREWRGLRGTKMGGADVRGERRKAALDHRIMA